MLTIGEAGWGVYGWLGYLSVKQTILKVSFFEKKILIIMHVWYPYISM